jgi:hypothetical protein
MKIAVDPSEHMCLYQGYIIIGLAPTDQTKVPTSTTDSRALWEWSRRCNEATY